MCIGAFVAPLGIIILCYLLIIYEVHTHSKKFKRAASDLKGKGSAQKKNDESAKKKKEVQTAKIACTITICWVVAWTPYAIVAIMGISFERAWLTPLVSQLPALFAKTAAVYNPLGEFYTSITTILNTVLQDNSKKRWRETKCRRILLAGYTSRLLCTALF
nr:rhabdomeric opsin [Acutuncus antarcticus]